MEAQDKLGMFSQNRDEHQHLDAEGTSVVGGLRLMAAWDLGHTPFPESPEGGY